MSTTAATTTVGSNMAATPATTTSPWVLDLVTGATTGAQPSAITILTSPTPLSGTHAGWMRASLRINMVEFKQANFVVEYEGEPEGYTLNIGDSPSNDGWSGDAGHASCAELQVAAQTLKVWGKPYGSTPACHVYGTQNYVLRDGSLKFAVRNHFVSVGQPYFPMQDFELFQLPDTAKPDGHNVYAGFNQVIRHRDDRVGHGLRRVMITLQQ